MSDLTFLHKMQAAERSRKRKRMTSWIIAILIVLLALAIFGELPEAEIITP